MLLTRARPLLGFWVCMWECSVHCSPTGASLELLVDLDSEARARQLLREVACKGAGTTRESECTKGGLHHRR